MCALLWKNFSGSVDGVDEDGAAFECRGMDAETELSNRLRGEILHAYYDISYVEKRIKA